MVSLPAGAPLSDGRISVSSARTSSTALRTWHGLNVSVVGTEVLDVGKADGLAGDEGRNGCHSGSQDGGGLHDGICCC